jgi:uncharacterized membrane protein (GlpM family)
VLVFALVSEMLEPKRFAGLFGAAPAVALAGLMIVLLDKGSHDAHQNAVGDARGMPRHDRLAAAVVPLLRRMKAPRATAGALVVWVAVAAIVAIPVLVA